MKILPDRPADLRSSAGRPARCDNKATRTIRHVTYLPICLLVAQHFRFNERNNFNPDGTVAFDDTGVAISIDESQELETDSGGIPDHQDLDSDGDCDGIPDSVEGAAHPNCDGVIDSRDTDSDVQSVVKVRVRTSCPYWLEWR